MRSPSPKCCLARIAAGSFPAFLLIFLAGACSDGETVQPVHLDLSGAGAYSVGVTTFVFVDTTRSTPANGEYPGATSRTVITEVWYPAVASGRETGMERTGAPFPLVVLSHGFSGYRSISTFFTEHLAGYGYVVAAPDFPLSHLGAPGGANSLDVLNQPGDVSLIIDRMAGFSSEPGHLFENGIDENAIGVAGHSLGGLTTLLVTFHAELSDPRIDASIPMAAVSCPFEEDFFRNREVPLLLIGGEVDLFIPFDTDPEASYRRARSPKYLLNIVHGTHMGFTDMNIPDSAGIELMSTALSESDIREEEWLNLISRIGNPENCESWEARHVVDVDDELEHFEPDRQRELVNIFSTAFFERYLKGKDEYRYFFTSDFTRGIPDIELESDP